MAISNEPLGVLLLLLLLLALAADAQQLPPEDSQLATGSNTKTLLEAPKIDCTSACKARCGRNWKNKMCNKMCSICCGKCSCVPSGTGQDTRSQCPCYANMVNSKNGKPKCP